jgi:uncharacterized protein
MSRIWFFLLFFASFLFSGPPVNSYVFDENRLLTTQETELFNLIAQELYNKTGVGLAAALYQDIGDEDPREFALKTAESFGIGKKGVDEGILIFVAMNQKRRSVEVGYGAEPYLPDVLVEKIQQQTLVPAFRQRKYGEGVISLAWALASHVAKEKEVTLNLGNVSLAASPEEKGEFSFIKAFFIFILILFLLFTKTGRNILYLMIISQMGRSSGRGGGGFGGGRSGGFGGGFGGGRFGGGGSGGSW